ncbi:phage protein NinX family protein [Pantoea allii]|uniref:phage protein NinX family protein n=1 Tax=Pantoea allii TaxID=574096 RepID=UPI003D322FF2
MNYAEMSDFEINWRAFELLHCGSPDFREGENGAMVLVSEEYDMKMGEHVTIEAVRGQFNPCKSWADAGQIIEEQGITIAKSVMSGWHSYDLRCVKKYTDENPLRAAMIVFLMMHEANNE